MIKRAHPKETGIADALSVLATLNYIYPAGILGCVLAGVINGIGSLFYYSALGRIGAGVGQLLYSLYPLFVALWLFLDRQPPSKMTILRLGLAFPAVFLKTQSGT